MEDLENQRSPWKGALIWQLVGLLGAWGLFWLHSGFKVADLGTPREVLLFLILGLWLLALALQILWVPARLGQHPGFPLVVALLPALGAVACSCLLIGSLPSSVDRGANCDLLLVTAFAGERLRFVGFLGSGTMMLACLPLLSAQTERMAWKRWGWLALASLVVLAAVVVWTFLDPLIPAQARIGSWPVRGLWPLVAAPFVFWVWARCWPRLAVHGEVVRASACAGAACLGLLLAAEGMLCYHRASGLHLAAFDSPAGGVRAEAGEVLATVLLRLAPVLLLAAAAALAAGLIRGRAGRKQLLAPLLLLGVAVALGGGYEGLWRQSFAGRCSLGSPEPLELPQALSQEDLGSGSLLALGEHRAWLNGEGVEPDRWPGGEGSAAAILVAADRRVTFTRLYPFLRASSQGATPRLRLVVRPVEGRDDPCGHDGRLFGVCLCQRLPALRALPIEVSHLTARSQPPPGVVANVLVDRQGMEVTFGGFGPGTPADVLDSLAAVLPDHLGLRDLSGLAGALTRAKERFPDSQALLLLPHDELKVQDLASLLEVARGVSAKAGGQGAPNLFPEITVGPLTR